ncbi:uncharacterized protein KY384_003301 [Bacidia gigantensis]|uniref:uncharacterized protein n=1 Tax=Bacidia gigantensis TaxID=2732470 RepID=UPI001D04EA78|nr:uncharacterized protein KY384_003301 [Bacidia gigantensis]KAG8531669.1 hypothetical protein KY384_003301 [Bacidia gigantensis]
MSKSLTSTTLIANSPQLLLYYLYFAYNSLYTCMLMGEEWSEFAYSRKSLRVTSPRETQRSTYRLQLPYRYGIPLMMYSGFQHWLVSQSFFLVILKAYDDAGFSDPDHDITTCGYSPSAVLATIIFVFVGVVTGLVLSCQKYKAGMPLVGSCSAAITAACHHPVNDGRASLKPVKWGVYERKQQKRTSPVTVKDLPTRLSVGAGAIAFEPDHYQQSSRSPEKAEYCSFASIKVQTPAEGTLYPSMFSQKPLPTLPRLALGSKKRSVRAHMHQVLPGLQAQYWY